MLAASAAALSLGVTGAYAQSGGVEKAVGGYTFEDAAKEAPGTKDFHSEDGQLTFAIVTHTAGNGFFDPVYVGAKVAGNMIGAKILSCSAPKRRSTTSRARSRSSTRSCRIRPSTA